MPKRHIVKGDNKVADDAGVEATNVAHKLNPLWSAVRPEALAIEPTILDDVKRPSISGLAKSVAVKITNDPESAEDLLYVPATFTDEQERYFVGSHIAGKLADKALDACDHQADDAACPSEIAAACELSRKYWPNDKKRRNAVFGAMLLMPEPQLEVVTKRFGRNASAIASTFGVPLIAAYLRLNPLPKTDTST